MMFFRCLATHYYYELAFGARSDSGELVDPKLAAAETSLADDFRHAVCTVLTKNIGMLEKIASKMNYVLDKTTTTQYSSVHDRIASMSRTSQFAGNVEIIAESYISRTQFHIHRSAATTSNAQHEMELIAKIPVNHFTYHTPIMLIYEEDRINRPGHFNLLLSKRTVLFPLTNSVDDVIRSQLDNCREIDKAIHLCHVLDPSGCSVDESAL